MVIADIYSTLPLKKTPLKSHKSPCTTLAQLIDTSCTVKREVSEQTMIICQWIISCSESLMASAGSTMGYQNKLKHELKYLHAVKAVSERCLY